MITQAKKVAGFVGAALAMLLMMAATAAAHDHPGPGPKVGKLAGTWKVTVNTYNCETQAAGPPFVSFLSFAEGGTMTEVTSNPVFQPGQRSIGLGTWAQTGRRTYWVSTAAFIQFDSPAAPPGVPPLFRGTQRLEQGITMTGRDSWKSEATNQLLRSTGEEYFFGCARAVAERLD